MLSNFYVYPTCSPTRASFLTGRYAHETGLTFALVGRAVGGVNTSFPTLASELKARGYHTALVGKLVWWQCASTHALINREVAHRSCHRR
jgi:arylsulfatase A-like enzyme